MVVLPQEDGMIRALLGLMIILATGCAKREYVVLYTSQDQFYAEPILKEFTAATGIEVRTVFDTESAKTAALAHRLRAEKSNPQCDVFWSNEEMHMRLLVLDGVIDADQVRTVGYRTREVVVNTNRVRAVELPKSIQEFAEERWREKVVLAYPLFGTTSAYFLALRQHWGEAKWREWCEALAQGTKVVDGNSIVVRLVGAGESEIGLTDSDDIEAGLRQNLPVGTHEVQERFLIPNTIAIVNGARRKEAAARLAEYLADDRTLQRLVELGAISGIHPPEEKEALTIDWSKADLEEMNETLKKIFLRS
jgi:iron(III) transport system substrate-binding protein